MKIKGTVCFLIMIFIITNCKKPTETKLNCINLDQIEQEKAIPLSTIADSIQYIMLQSSDSAFIGAVDELIFTDTYIYISDRQLDRILQFSRNGEFIRQIGRIGKGPGEYTSIFCFCASDPNNIIIANTPGSHFLAYDTLGNFTHEMTKPSKPIYVDLKGNQLVQYSLYSNAPLTDGYALSVTDLTNLKTQRRLFRSYSPQNLPRLGSFSRRYLFNDTICYWEFIFDTIYGLSTDLEVTARWQIKADNRVKAESYYSEPGQVDKEIQDGKLMISGIVETDSCFFISLVENKTRKNILYYKRTHLSFQCRRNDDKGNISISLLNDIDGGIDFWPQKQLDDGSLVNIINANVFIDFIDNKIDHGQFINSQLLAIRNKIDYNDNPILMIIKPR